MHGGGEDIDLSISGKKKGGERNTSSYGKERVTRNSILDSGRKSHTCHMQKKSCGGREWEEGHNNFFYSRSEGKKGG